MTPEQFHEGVLARAAAVVHAPVAAMDGIELDLPHNVERGRAWLAQQPAPTEGTASDTLYAQAAWLLDYGLSYDVVLDMLDLHSPGYDRDDIGQRVYNATKHRQNEIGAHAAQGMLLASAEKWLVDHPPQVQAPLSNRVVGWADIRNAVYPRPWWWWQDRCIGDDSNLYTGRAKVGKTTLILNLTSAVCGGAQLLGKDTRQGHVFLLAGEDRYGEVRDNIKAISHSLQVHDEALAQSLTLFSVRSERVEGGHRLAQIDDAGIVTHSRFLTEVIMPHLISLPKPCLFIIDPVAVFFGFNRYADAAARALVDGFCAELARLGITPLLTDHPSQSSIENGRNVAGSVQMEASFPLVATLKAEKWQGLIVPQRKMSFELMGSRYGAETDGDVEFYRLKSSPAFSMAAAPGHGERDHMMAVYRYVCRGLKRAPKPLYCCDRLGSGADSPAGIAPEIGVSEIYTKKAIDQCVTDRWLEWRVKSGVAKTSSYIPRHLVPGSNAPRLDLPDAPNADDGVALW